MVVFYHFRKSGRRRSLIFLHLRERDRRRKVKTQKFPKLKNSEYRSELAKLLDPIGMLIAVT